MRPLSTMPTTGCRLIISRKIRARSSPTAPSPTNIGLLLLSTLAARDFGHVGLLEIVERFERTLATLRRLEKFQGHSFNWYETATLKPLSPLSPTVDSGNLAAHLIAVKQAVIELPEQTLFDLSLLRALDGHASAPSRRSETIRHNQRAHAICHRQAVEPRDRIVCLTG